MLLELLPPAEHITHSPRGRPLATGGASVSVSHTKGYLAAAHCVGAKIGIDLSGPEDFRHLTAAAPAFLTPQEAKLAEQMKGPTHLWRLQHLWVLKEALLKGIGIGIGLDPALLSFRYGPDGWTCPMARRWRFEVREIAPNFVCAVAIKSDHLRIKWGTEVAAENKKTGR